MQRFDEIFDQLIQWYKAGGEDELPPELATHKLRWMQIRDYIMTHHPKHDGEVVSHFCIDWKLSEATVYHEVRCAKRFYAHCEPAVQAFDKIVLVAQIKRLRQTAMQAEKFAVAAKCDQNLIQLGEYDKPQAEELKAPSVLEVHLDFNPVLVGAKRDPALLGMVKKFLGEKAQRELLIHDIDYVDVLPDEPEPLSLDAPADAD